VTATSRRGVWVAIVVAVVLGIPLLVLAVRVSRSHWLSLSDWALIELRTRDVGTVRTPLVGPYSRYGWNHPGPLLFYALAPGYRLLAEEAKGLLLGALAVNTASLAAIGVVCWRRGRACGLLLGTLVILLLVRALKPGFLVDPWNPNMIVFPMLAVFFLCWASTDRDGPWAFPLAIGVGSFAVQTHVGASIGVLVPIAIALVYVIIDRRALRTTLIAAAIVGVVCWIPPIVQEVRPGGTQRNLSALWSFWTSTHANTTGWHVGARIAGAQLAIPAPWLTGHEARSIFTGGVDPGWHVPFALLFLIGALVVAARRHDTPSTRLCVLALGLVGAAFVSAARIVDVPFYYVVQWIWIVGAVAWFAVIWTAVRALSLRRPATMAAAAAVAVLVVFVLVGSVRASFPNPGNDERSLSAFAPDARRALRALDSPVVIESPSDVRSRTMADGILALAIHAGVDARLPLNEAFIVGKGRTIDPARARNTVGVAVNDAASQYRDDPAFRSIASYDPLSPDERAEQQRIATVATAALKGGVDAYHAWSAAHPGAADRLRALDGRGPRIELFERVDGR
jgi:hypothetical protein